METMPPEMQEKYAALSDKNASLQKTIDAIQQELDTITKEKAFLEQQIASSPVRKRYCTSNTYKRLIALFIRDCKFNLECNR